MSSVAFIVIGRNEGERLKRCLAALKKVSNTIVYVDSGSSDGSCEFARGLGIEVVDLDTSAGFTMARGRNAGVARLLEISPDAEFLHFIDGDCELIEGWVPLAHEFLSNHPEVAAVCGRRRERHPEASVYNLLCEIEWNTPVGEALASGGDVLMRREAFCSAGGFNDSLIAYEEPDLCRRLRNRNWKIWRLEADMTRHDASILRFSQWWKRHERAGYGAMVITRLCAEEGDAAAVLHFSSQVRSPRNWVALAAAWMLIGVPIGVWMGGVSGGGLVLLGGGFLFIAQSWRIAQGIRNRSPDQTAALLYGLFTMIAKIPQLLGQIRYLGDLAKNRKAEIIEYK